MHAKRHHWLTLILGCLFVAVGCRGTQPLSRFVQVRKDPAAAVSEIEAPRQRLATIKPRAGSQAQINADADQPSMANNQDPPVHVELPSKAAPPSAASNQSFGGNSQTATSQTQFRTHLGDGADSDHSKSQPTATHLSSDRSAAAQPVDGATVPPRTRASDKPIRSIASAPPSKRIQLPKDATQDELLQAFRDSPPEVKQQAMRQLVAALSRNADTTTQPGALNKALADSLSGLPELPPETNVPANAPPNRLARSETKSHPSPANAKSH